MSALEILSQPVWRQLAWTLLHFVWQGAIVGMLLMLALSVVRQSQARYSISLAALLALVMCPLVTLLLTVPMEANTSLAIAAFEGDASQVEVASWSSFALALLQAAQPYVVLAWLLGVTLFGLRLLVSYLGVRYLRSSADLLPNERLPALRTLAKRMHVQHRVRAAASHVVREAMVIGLWRPLILIPAAWLTEMPAQALEAILAHELAHIRRHDLWVNLLQRVVETLLFYHPAVWYVSRSLRIEREKCCDELAVAATGERLAYVEALELVAHRRLAASPSVWAAAMGGAKTMNLLERVRNVLGLRPATSAGRYWPVGIAALALPLGLWCATAAFTPAVNADDSDKPSAEAKKDGEKKEGEKKEGDKKDGEKKDGERQEGERREGDRPREGRPEGARDGERRPEGPRDGERRPMGIRDGERRFEGPRDGERRPEGPRDGERRPAGPRDGERRPEGPRDGERPNPMHREGQPPVPPELMRAIMELRMEVQQLRREMQEMREHRGPRPEGGRPEGPRREGEGRRPEGGRPRGEGDRPRPEGERERARPEGERPRPEGDRR